MSNILIPECTKERPSGRKNVCPYCGKKFTNTKQFIRHQVVHNYLKEFKCPDCFKLFKSKSSLQRHQIHSHRGLKNHKCEECNASFAQYTNLKAHIARLHSRQVRSRSYACSDCSCVFTRLNALNRHMTVRHAQKENFESEMLRDDAIVEDPNQLAMFVVAQLKSLEKEISCTSNVALVNENVKENKNVTKTPEEKTCVDMAKISQTTINDRLNPNGVVQTLNVQTVKRPRERFAFVCEYCAKEFKKSYDFIRHLRTHNNERPYKCSDCTMRFGTKSQLQLHSKRMHILDEKTGFFSNKHECCICNLNFDSMRKLDIHISSHAPGHVVCYMCSTCNAQFRTVTAFSTHKHKTEDTTLDILEQLIPEPIILNHSTKAGLVKAIKNQHFICKTCGLRLNNEEAFKKHKNHHSITKKFKCNICGRSFANKLILHVHQKIHTAAKLFFCDKCNSKNFPTKSQLQRHCRLVHESIRNVQCVYCPKTFKNKAHCKSHMKTHLKRLLKTKETDKNSPTTSPLKAKALVQTSEPPSDTSTFVEIELLHKCRKHKHNNIQIEKLNQQQSTTPISVSPTKNLHICTHCRKHFQKPSDLVRHERTHTEERPFECPTCNKKFKLKSTLEDHQKIHQNLTERKKFACQVCEKSYASSKSLSVHWRIHTGALPFKCDYCGKAFRTSGHRLSHMKATKAKNGQCKKVENIFN